MSVPRTLVRSLVLLYLLSSASPTPAQPAYSPGQILVKFQAAALKPTAGSLQNLARRYGVHAVEPLFSHHSGLSKPAGPFGRIYRLRIAPGANPREAAAAYAAHPGVVYAQPNHLFRPHQAPNDPQYGSQTGLSIIRWQNLWEGLGPRRQEVVLAIIDSGIDHTHEDLADNIWTNPAEAEGRPGVDDDGNGYIDDIRGWDFSDAPDLPGRGDYLTPDNDPADESGHGTHVAGIAGAVANNGAGIAGVAPDARLMALRAGVTLQSGGTFLEEDDLAAAILYAVDNGAHIVNMSWGAPERAFLIQDAVRYAADNGLILVASSGNTGEPGLAYPADDDETIAVSATDRSDHIAGFSSRGVPLDLTAPGANTLSTQPGNAYGRRSGTSFSAPFVSGLVALLLSRRPGLTPEQVRASLTGATVDLGAPGWDGDFGAGRIDAAALLPVIAQPHAPPTVRIHAPRTGQAAETDFEVTAQVSGSDPTAYRLSWGVGRMPQSWVPLLSGPPDTNIHLLWDVSFLPDTTAVLRLEADLSDGGTLEDRVLVSVRRTPPTISGAAFNPILQGPRIAYEVRWTTHRPTEGFLLYRPSGAAGEDTLASIAVDRTHKVTLPEHLPAGSLHYRILARGLSGRTTLTDPDSFEVVPLALPRDGYTEVAALPDGFLGDRPADFDGDGRPEIALMPYIEGTPFSPPRILERQDDGAFQQVFESERTFLPWSIGDADNDGAPDLLGVDVVRLRLFVGTQANPFPSVQTLDRTRTRGGEIADLDGDEQNEVLARSNAERGIRILKYRSDGAFEEAAFLSDPTAGSGDLGSRFVIADLDGDGRNEILAGDADGDLWTGEIDETGGYTATWILEGDDATNAGWVGGGADLDNDGILEFAVARAVEEENDPLNGAWNLEIYGATGPDAYALEWSTRISGVIATGNGIATGDTDGDGIPDLAVCLLPDLYLFRADGPDTYRPIWHSRASLTHRPIIADLDANGRPEILFNRNGAIRIFERTAPLPDTLAPQILNARPLGPDRIRLDWTASPGATAYRLFRGTGADTLTPLIDGLTHTAYLDTGLTENRLYRYAVAARLPGGREVRSSTAAARPNRAPDLMRLTTLGSNRLALTFSEPVGPADPDGYAVAPNLGRPTSAIRDRENRRIVLTFRVPFTSGVTYTLTLNTTADTSGVPLAADFRRIDFLPDHPLSPSARVADFDGDGRVAFTDFVLFARAFGTADPAFDLDGDGRVAFADFIRFAGFFGQTVRL